MGQRGFRAGRGNNFFDFLLERRFKAGFSLGAYAESGSNVDKVLVGKVFRLVDGQIKVQSCEELNFEGIQFVVGNSSHAGIKRVCFKEIIAKLGGNDNAHHELAVDGVSVDESLSALRSEAVQVN